MRSNLLFSCAIFVAASVFIGCLEASRIQSSSQGSENFPQWDLSQSPRGFGGFPPLPEYLRDWGYFVRRLPETEDKKGDKNAEQEEKHKKEEGKGSGSQKGEENKFK